MARINVRKALDEAIGHKIRTPKPQSSATQSKEEVVCKLLYFRYQFHPPFPEAGKAFKSYLMSTSFSNKKPTVAVVNAPAVLTSSITTATAAGKPAVSAYFISKADLMDLDIS